MSERQVHASAAGSRSVKHSPCAVLLECTCVCLPAYALNWFLFPVCLRALLIYCSGLTYILLKHSAPAKCNLTVEHIVFQLETVTCLPASGWTTYLPGPRLPQRLMPDHHNSEGFVQALPSFAKTDFMTADASSKDNTTLVLL